MDAVAIFADGREEKRARITIKGNSLSRGVVLKAFPPHVITRKRFGKICARHAHIINPFELDRETEEREGRMIGVKVFLALSLCLATTRGLYFHISETEMKCFIEEVPAETMIVGKHSN